MMRAGAMISAVLILMSVVVAVVRSNAQSDRPLEAASEARRTESAVSGPRTPDPGPRTNEAIGIGNIPADATLSWLAARQEDDGSFGGDVRTTGLALLAFLGTGQTHKHGLYKKQVKNALRYLKQRQLRDRGSFGTGSGDVEAVATLALCEAYALTASPLFKQPAQRAVDSLFERDDISFLWRVMVWESARVSELRPPDGIKEKLVEAIAWAPHASGRALARIFTGEEGNEEDIHAVLRIGPIESDPVFTWVGTLATFLHGGRILRNWREQFATTVLPLQIAEGEGAGSWGGDLTKTATLKIASNICQAYPCPFRRER